MLNQKNPHVGAVAGQNSSKGIIGNCGVTGNIKMNGLENGFVGGITSYSNGTIKNTYNKASITGEWVNVNAGIMGMGGICSSLGNNEYSQIIASYNEGNIISIINDEKSNVCIGGITGYTLEDGNEKIMDCYNSGKITIDSKSSTIVGGIVGKIGSGIMTNCYNIGEMQFQKVSGKEIIGMLVGKNDGIVRNSYYKEFNDYLGIGNGNKIEGITSEEDIVKNENEMKSDEFVELLNSESNIWKRHNSQNNGYPILDWQ